MSPAGISSASVLDGTFKKFPPGARAFGTGRIKCGTESNGGFINITITGNVFEGCLGYALESVDGALLEDITISNTTMRDLGCGPLFLRLGARLRGPKDTTKIGTLKRVLISNLECYNAPMRQASILSGIPGSLIEDVKLSNIYIESLGGGTAEMAQAVPTEQEDGYPEPGRFGPTPSSGFFLRHMKNLEMSHVEIANSSADARPRVCAIRCQPRRLLRHHRPSRRRRRLCSAWRERFARRLEPRRRRHHPRQRRRQDDLASSFSRTA